LGLSRFYRGSEFNTVATFLNLTQPSHYKNSENDCPKVIP